MAKLIPVLSLLVSVLSFIYAQGAFELADTILQVVLEGPPAESGNYPEQTYRLACSSEQERKAHMNLLAHAIKLASTAHEHQLDKSGLPYILHPLRVMMLVQASGRTETPQIAAVLHDIVEDTETDIRTIEIEFGTQVAEAVDALTHRRGADDVETYREYVVRCCKNPIGRIVKRYDIQDNMDPKRYHEDAPYKRYLWALGHLHSLDEKDRRSTEEAIAKAGHGVIS